MTLQGFILIEISAAGVDDAGAIVAGVVLVVLIAVGDDSLGLNL